MSYYRRLVESSRARLRGNDMGLEVVPAGDMRLGNTRSVDTRLRDTREYPPNTANQTQQPSTPLGDGGGGGSRRNILNHHRGKVGNCGGGAGAQFTTQQRTCIILDGDSDGEGDVQFLGDGENSCPSPRQPCELGGRPAYVGCVRFTSSCCCGLAFLFLLFFVFIFTFGLGSFG